MATKRNPFREAKQYLWDGTGHMGNGQTEFICWALANTSIAIVRDRHVATRMVENRLGGWQSTVYSWLWNNKKIKRCDLNYRNVQFFRHRWLDHLADEWDRGVRK